MKKLIKIFPIICLLIVTSLAILYFDEDVKYKYTNFDGYKLTGISFNPNSKAVNVENLEKIERLANENNVILSKELYQNGVTDVFVSSSNINDFLAILGLHSKLIHDVNSDDQFIATYITNDKNQKYYIPDFLNNHKYKYGTITSLIKQQGYVFGDYSLFYKNDEQLNSFISSTEKILNTNKSDFMLPSWGRLTKHSNYIFIIMILALVLSVLFFFVFQIFQLYKRSKAIGCMRLLGFSSRAISRKFIIPDMKLLLPFSSIMIIIVSFICKNLTGKILISIILLNMLMIILNMITKIICVKIIIANYSLSNILKKEALALKISKIAISMKTLVSLSFLIFVVFLFPQVYDTYNDVKYYKNIDYMSDYAVFSKVNVENKEWKNNDNFLKFYKQIKQDKKIQVLYADFSNYYMSLTENEKQILEQSEKAGTFYRFATIDDNYLKKYNLKLLNDVGENVQSSKKLNEYIIFPKSKHDIVNKFMKFYEQEYKDSYTKHNLSVDLKYYFYEDQSLPTYDSTGKINHVDSPIVRVINTERYPISYNEDPIGLDIAGTGMSTKLKFNIQDGKQKVLKNLSKDIKSANLDGVLRNENFISYSEYYNDGYNRLRKSVIVLLTGIVISLIIYLQIIFQTFCILLASKMTKIRVKQLLGFKKRDVLKEILYVSIISSLVPASCILVYNIFHNQGIVVNILILFLFMVFEITTNLMMAKFINFNKVNVGLKGENDD